MPRINLLPREIKVRRRQRRILAIVTVVGVVVLVFLGFVWLLQRGTIGREEDRLTELQARQARLAQEVGGLQEFANLQANVERHRQVLATALTGDIAWSRFLNDLSLIMPDNSWLTNLTLRSGGGTAPTGEPSFGTLGFTGFTFDFPGLAGWLVRVDQIDGLTFLYLGSGSRTTLHGREVVSFSSNAHMNAAMLSQRCQADRPCP